jgi:phage tail tape-measure protein
LLAPLQKYEAFEAVLLESAAKEVEFLEGQLQAVPTDSASTEQEAPAQGAVQHQEDVSMMDTAGSEQAGMEAAAAGMDVSFGSPAAGGSPAATGFAGAETRTPHNTPAAATLGGDGTVTSPGARYRSSSATTAAPPKSALAKPKSGSSSAAPKHAHVVVPDAASPKTTPAAKTTAGELTCVLPRVFPPAQTCLQLSALLKCRLHAWATLRGYRSMSTTAQPPIRLIWLL